MEDGVLPLVVTVYNDDRSDPWSVYALGNVRPSSGAVRVQDAVDQAALEAAARAMLARALEQQELKIQVLPDPTLQVHDVIEVRSPHEEIAGRWLVQALRPVISAANAVVEISARRSISSVGVTYGGE